MWVLLLVDLQGPQLLTSSAYMWLGSFESKPKFVQPLPGRFLVGKLPLLNAPAAGLSCSRE